MKNGVSTKLIAVVDQISIQNDFSIGDKYEIKKMTDLREDNPEKCVIIGTTFVQQKLKPSILREISEETQLAPQPIRQNFADESDTLILEDEVQRIQLLGDFPVDQYVTGIVMAVLGKLVEFDLF